MYHNFPGLSRAHIASLKTAMLRSLISSSFLLPISHAVSFFVPPLSPSHGSNNPPRGPRGRQPRLLSQLGTLSRRLEHVRDKGMERDCSRSPVNPAEEFRPSPHVSVKPRGLEGTSLLFAGPWPLFLLELRYFTHFVNKNFHTTRMRRWTVLCCLAAKNNKKWITLCMHGDCLILRGFSESRALFFLYFIVVVDWCSNGLFQCIHLSCKFPSSSKQTMCTSKKVSCTNRANASTRNFPVFPTSVVVQKSAEKNERSERSEVSRERRQTESSRDQGKLRELAVLIIPPSLPHPQVPFPLSPFFAC